MKLEEDTEVPRLDEGEPSELGSFVRAARMRGPSAPAAARMAERLAPAARVATALTSSRRVGFLGRAFGPKLVLLALVALGSALLVVQARTSEYAGVPETPIAAPPATAAWVAPSLAMNGNAPTLPVDALPASAATPPAASTATRISTARPVARPEKSSSPAHEDEFALVRRAQDALASNPARALELLRAHERSFPNGELTQERETIAVEALTRLHRKAEAKTRASALLARFPRTPYVARLERALGEPISAAHP